MLCHIYGKAGRGRGPVPRKLKLTFPVHPEVEMAKRRIVACWQAQDWQAYARAVVDMRRALDRHHPRESRPLEQLDYVDRPRRAGTSTKPPRLVKKAGTRYHK